MSEADNKTKYAATVVRTETGSRYRFRTDKDGRWFISGENASSAFSASIAGNEWEIEMPLPWPPLLGQPVHFEAVSHLAKDYENPLRIPGGGKTTSWVVDVAVEKLS